MNKPMTVLVALSLAGCASNMRWVKGDATTADFEREKLECQYEATKATASGGNFGMSSSIGAGVAEGLKQIELMSLCLRTKGWTQQRVPS